MHRIKSVCTVLVLALGLSLGPAAFFGAAHQALATSEVVFNDCAGDHTDYAILVVGYDNSVHTLQPCKSSFGTLGMTRVRAFKLLAWECAMVSYNYGPRRLRGPGYHQFDAGAIVHVNPFVC
jgi:hypothetical protein